MSPETYCTVTQACRKLGVPPHVLRYWEQEFELKLKRNSAGRRILSSAQMERLRLIKHLLRDEKLTVKGAKRQLTKMNSQPTQPAASKDARQTLLWLKKELISVREMLGPES
jgi:DNA-binding transcriptional MerR regulator